MSFCPVHESTPIASLLYSIQESNQVRVGLWDVMGYKIMNSKVYVCRNVVFFCMNHSPDQVPASLFPSQRNTHLSLIVLNNASCRKSKNLKHI